MDTIVLDHRLEELLELPRHYPGTPDISPKARALADDLVARMYSLPRHKHQQFIAIAEAWCARADEWRQRRLAEEMGEDPPPAA